MNINKKLVIGTLSIAIVLVIVPSFAFADESTEFSSITRINETSIGAIINSEVAIEESGAYGYGVVTGAGLEGILVTTTHKGVLDSAAQTDADDGRFHNHYVALQDSKVDGSGLCPTLEVKDISWDEPGSVAVLEDVAVFEGPTEFKSTHSLTGDEVAFNNLGPVGAVASFTITPVDGSGNTSVDSIAAVCIDAVGDAEPLIDKSSASEKP